MTSNLSETATKEEVTLAPEDQETLIQRIAEKVSSTFKTRQQAESKEDEATAAIVDLIDEQIEKRVKEKPVEQPKPALTLAKTPEERMKELEAELAKLKEGQKPAEKPATETKSSSEPEKKLEQLAQRPVPEPTATVSNLPQGFEDEVPEEVRQAVEEVVKNRQAGFTALWEYLLPNKKQKER